MDVLSCYTTDEEDGCVAIETFSTFKNKLLIAEIRICIISIKPKMIQSCCNMISKMQ